MSVTYPYKCCSLDVTTRYFQRTRKGAHTYHAFCVEHLPEKLSDNWREVCHDEWSRKGRTEESMTPKKAKMPSMTASVA